MRHYSHWVPPFGNFRIEASFQLPVTIDGVENRSDELWIGVKGQSNLEIAGSPRNIFRYSLATLSIGGRALNGLGGSPAY